MRKRLNSFITAKARIIYPLVDMVPMDKQDVLDWWREQPFDLDLPEHLGNCTWCWKKSLNKHFHDMPEAFDFPERMEHTYPLVGPDNPTVPRRFFRKYLSVADIRAQYAALNGKLPRISKVDENGGCSESCELFPMIEGG